MRVFTASLATETNTFGPLPTSLRAFREGLYYPAGTHPPEMSFFSGPLWAARQRAASLGWTVFEGLVAAAQPSGPVTRDAYETLRDQLLADLEAVWPVDMVVLGLHGAMVADGYLDCEGDLLQRIRTIVGPSVVIGATLDPHSHLSAQMVENADLLISWKEYPHTDIRDRSFELVDLCAAKVQGILHPVPGCTDCEMIAVVHTTREPGRSFIDRLKQQEGRDGVVSISVVHGFAWGDTPDMGTKILVYTDGTPERAQRLSQDIAAELVAMRDELRVRFVETDVALDQALSVEAGPVVIADSADNPGGGAAGDSTFILRRMLERGITNACVGAFWDPIAVSIAFDAGVGATIPLRIGGKIGPLSGLPLDVTCTIRALQPAMRMSCLDGTSMELGDSALIEVAGIEIVLISIRGAALDTDLFTQLGVDPSQRRIVVVKSSQHFYASFSRIAQHVLYAAAPGTLTDAIETLPYRNLTYPRWPLPLPSDTNAANER